VYEIKLFEAPGYIEQVNPNVLPEDLKDLEAMEKLVRAAMVLTPIFQDMKFVWTDEAADELLTKGEEFGPTPEVVVEQHEGRYGNRIDTPLATDVLQRPEHSDSENLPMLGVGGDMHRMMYSEFRAFYFSWDVALDFLEVYTKSPTAPKFRHESHIKCESANSIMRCPLVG
jgi:hypothetical protein